MEQIPAVYEGDIIIVYSKWYDWKTILSILNNTLLLLLRFRPLPIFLNRYDFNINREVSDKHRV